MSILGNRVLRREDPKFLTAGGSYVADVDLGPAVHLTFVRSNVAHARLVAVDVSEARRADGVVAVFTNEDLGLAPLAPLPVVNQAMVRPVLASGVVRYVGEPIAVVVSDTPAAGADAAELVVVDYDPLPVVVDPEVAQRGAALLFPELGTNVCLELDAGERRSIFDDAEVLVSQRMVNQRVAPCPLEVRSGAARITGDGRLEYYASTQAPHRVRDTIARALSLDRSAVHVISPDVGGGFGAKGSPYVEDLVVAWCAHHLGCLVRWTETRSESMANLGHGRGQIQQVTLGGRRDGTITAYHLDVLQDAGAYPAIGALLPNMTRAMTTGVYGIDKAGFSSESVVTNTMSTVAYRGAGRPEATAAIERAVDLFAAEIGLDPAEVRRKNLIPGDAFPFATATGTVYDTGAYEQTLDLALEVADYAALRTEQQRRRDAAERLQLGIGLCCYVEITNGLAHGEFGAVEVRCDGTVMVRTGTSPHGQGHVTAWSMLVADVLGVPIGSVEVVHGDTDVVPRGAGTMGSRSLQVGGTAVAQAAGDIVEQGRARAAELLEAAPADVVLDKAEGRFHVVGTPALSRSWAELAAASLADGLAPLMAEVDLAESRPTFPFGTHLAVVEVDTETGEVRLIRHVAVDDAGRIVNPLLAEGQVHGGIAQGVAQALYEAFVYDPDGNPLTASFIDYAVPSAVELPRYETRFTETPTPLNALGVKGIGESGTIGAAPAVHNAVCDALAHLGVRHIDMPLTPRRIWEAIEASGTEAE